MSSLRSNSFGSIISINDAPKSTSKALLVSILAPRRISTTTTATTTSSDASATDTKKPKEDATLINSDDNNTGSSNHALSNDGDSSNNSSSISMTRDATKSSSSTSLKSKAKTSTSRSENVKVKESASSAAAADDDEKSDPVATEKTQPKLQAENKDEKTSAPQERMLKDKNSDTPTEKTLSQGKLEEKESVLEDKDEEPEPGKDESEKDSKQKEDQEQKDEEQEDEEEEPTPEEQAAIVPVTKGDEDPGETSYDVNMEQLLRIAFTNLFEECNVMNVPVYTLVNQLKQKSPQQQPQTLEFSWIQVQVMAHPSSLGIILDRMERIGVGTNCGTLAIFPVELCRTASIQSHLLTAEGPENSDTDKEVVEGGTGSEQKVSDERNMNVGVPINIQPTSVVQGDSRPTMIEEENEDAVAAEEREDDDSADSKEKIEQIKNQQQQQMERTLQAARMEWKNAATRLRIEQVREQISEQAAMSFDFLSLLAVASILAGVGLITNNTVVIVASMLVSPIMGPVLGLTFGSRIMDWPLVRSSLKNETLALLGCVFWGALIGIGSSFTEMAQEDWPTNEMQIRGESNGLLTGIAIAIPSGMGVCLSVLGGNTSSLVGVAISASLLPPAVNSGICFIYALFLKLGWVESDNGKDANDFVEIAYISFALTALNIVCIWVSGLVMFEIKEVAPIKEQKSAFWAKDIKVARELNKQASDREKPPPVDVSILRKGLETALKKQESLEQVTTDAGHLQKIQFQAAAAASPKRSNFPLDDAWALKERRANQAGLLGPVSWAGFTMPKGGTESTDDTVRYVGLEDMGALLGFDEEDEHSIDHVAVARRIGRGRYI